MSDFVFHPDAVKDIEEIWDYVAGENIDAADRLLQELYQEIRSLVAFPRTGHSRPDLTTAPSVFKSFAIM